MGVVVAAYFSDRLDSQIGLLVISALFGLIAFERGPADPQAQPVVAVAAARPAAGPGRRLPDLRLTRAPLWDRLSPVALGALGLVAVGYAAAVARSLQVSAQTG